MKKRFLLCFLLFVSFNVWGQTVSSPKISITLKNASFDQFVSEIFKKGGFKVFYNAGLKEKLPVVNIDIKSAGIDQIMTQVLTNTQLTYKLSDKTVVILEKEKKNLPDKIKGIIYDSNKQPLPSVAVMLKGSNKGVYSDINGQFEIMVLERPCTLTFSFIGMKREEILLTDQSQLEIILKDDENMLGEAAVISTGYQNLSKRDMVGALTIINAEDIYVPAYTTIDKMLQGQVPGMIVQNSSSRAGASANIKIRGTTTLLGNQNPLWVVDGIIQEDPIPLGATFPVTADFKEFLGNQISWLNPQDIETIVVLKDASATAVYGSRASNGVIVVNTKQGKSNVDRYSVNFSSNLTVKSKPNYSQFNLMDSYDRMKFTDEVITDGSAYLKLPIKQQYSYEGLKRLYYEGDIDQEAYMEGVDFLANANTDWLDILTRTAVSQNHNLSITGGSKMINFMSSLSYSNDQGQEIGNSADRISGRISIGVQLRDNLRLNLSMVGIQNNKSAFGRGVNPLNYALNTSRSIPAYDRNGNLAFYRNESTYRNNKGITDLGYNIINERDQSGSSTGNSTMNFNGDLSWDIKPWMKYQFTVGYSTSNTHMESYAGERTYYIANAYRGYDYGSVLPTSADFAAAVLPFGGELYTVDSRQKSYNIQNKININKTFNSKHRINFLLGQEIRSVRNSSISSTAWGYVPERGEIVISPSLIDNITPIGNSPYDYLTGYGIFGTLYSGRWGRIETHDNYVSLFSTFAYTFNNRYVVNLSVRNDMSNRFGQNVNKRIDPTYSFGASWNAAKEEFVINKLPWITQFNMRASYGIQGNVLTNLSPELILSRGSVLPVFNQYSSIISKIPNPDLSWERTTTWNIGLDAQLFEMINLNVDYYGRRSNAIISQEIPYEFGIASTLMNGGVIYNRGVEAALTIVPIQTEDYGLSIGINSSKNWNEGGKPSITPNLTMYLLGRGDAILREGYPIGGFWSYSFAGINSETGAPMFNKMDADPELSKNDPTTYLVYSGQKDPYFTGGITLNLRVKQFTLSTGFNALLGGVNRLPNPYSNFSTSGNRIPTPELNLNRDLNNRWKKPGDELFTNIPALTVGTVYNIKFPDNSSVTPLNAWAQSDYMTVDASFLRCRSLDLSWRAGNKVLTALNFKSLNVTMSLNNLFVIASKRYNGFDPELGTSVMPKTFTLGLNIGF